MSTGQLEYVSVAHFFLVVVSIFMLLFLPTNSVFYSFNAKFSSNIRKYLSQVSSVPHFYVFLSYFCNKNQEDTSPNRGTYAFQAEKMYSNYWQDYMRIEMETTIKRFTSAIGNVQPMLFSLTSGFQDRFHQKNLPRNFSL